jgi:hypothetical protein
MSSPYCQEASLITGLRLAGIRMRLGRRGTAGR